MRRPLVFACVLIVVLGATTLALRWQLARGADALMVGLAQALAPQATLSWRTTFAGFDGRLGARDLVLTPNSGAPPITIDALVLDPGGLGATLTAITPWSRQELPPRLRVALAGVRLPRIEPFAAAHDAAATSEPALGLDALDVVPCGGLTSAGALQALGETVLVFDAEFGWAFDREARRVQLDGTVRGHGLAELDVELELEARDNVTMLDRFARARPVARRGGITLTERGWLTRTAALCASRSALDHDPWVAAHAAAVEHLLAAVGIEPTPGLVAGYRAFRAAPVSMRVGFDNAALRGADELLTRGPDELAALIGLTVEFNHVPVAEAGFGFAAPQRLLATAPLADAPRVGGEALAEASVRSLLAPLVGTAPTPAARSRATPRRAAPLHSTTLTPNRTGGATGVVLSWDALGRERGRTVVVRMYDGRELSGVLRDVTPWRLTLEQKIGRGSAVLPLAREDIARVNAGG